MSNIEADYERVRASCENGHANTYNRVSDLMRTDAIDGMEVRCEECGMGYWISGDSINAPYEMLLFDCSELRKEKRYMYCILNICQAYEMFFSLYFRSLVYRAFVKDRDLDRVNELLKELHEVLSGFTFPILRCNFLRSVVAGVSPLTMDEAKAELDKLNKDDRDASKVDLAACADPKLRMKLERVRDTEIHRLRNKVAHDGYRPTAEQVNTALEEAKEVLFVVPTMLGVRGDEIGFYFI